MSDTTQTLERLFVAMFVGLLIGVDRERAELRKHRRLFAGVRTFALISLLGAILTLLRTDTGVWPLVAGFAAVAAIAVVSYREGTRLGDPDATTEIAALATFALGALAGTGRLAVTGAVGVTIAVLLAMKPRLEGFSRAISESDLSAALELAVISAIVLPLLPDRGYGPWAVLNPFRIWLVVVFVSAVSFAGFLAVRWKGPRTGFFWAAGVGALVSSTATTAAMAAAAREAPERGPVLAAAAALASTVVCGRLAVVVAVVGPSMLPHLLPALGTMAAVGLASMFILLRHSPAQASPDPGQQAAGSLKNPFSLRAALVFGALYGATLLLVRGSEAWLGTKGTLLAAGLSGLVDVDAISIALARRARPDAVDGAVVGVVVACASNNLFKTILAVVNGAGRFRRDVAIVLGAMALAGGGTAALTLLAF